MKQFLMFAFLFFIYSFAHAKDIFVDNTLSKDITDGTYEPFTRGSGGSSGNAYRDPQSAIEIMQPGDTVLVRAGKVYENLTPYFVDKHGKPDAWLTFKNYPGEMPIFDGKRKTENGIVGTDVSYLIIEGFYCTGYKNSGIGFGWVDSDKANGPKGDGVHAEHVIIRYCISEGNGSKGIAYNNINNSVIEYCFTPRNGEGFGPSWSSGITVTPAGNPAGKNNVVRNCISFHNIDVTGKQDTNGVFTDGNGFIADFGYLKGEVSFVNNFAFLNGGAGIIATDTGNTKILHNVCYHNGWHINVNSGEITLSGEDSYKGTVIMNNIGVKGNHVKGVYEAFFVDRPEGEGFFKSANQFFSENTNVFSLFSDLDNFNVLPEKNNQLNKNGVLVLETIVGMNFDKKAIKKVDKPQPFSWWKYEMDLAYIENIGGIKSIFKLVH